MRYIGSKTRILDFISDTVNQTYGSVEDAVVADLFAGTCSVAEMFKKHNAQIITNDYLRFSYALQIAKVKCNSEPQSQIPYTDALSYLNAINGVEGFFFKEYTLEGTAQSEFSRNYFDGDNARKIDAICLQLASWLKQEIISEDMFYLLSASLVDAITKVSNTSGTYGAFLKIDDQRKYKPLELIPYHFTNNGKDNKSFCMNISDVIDKISGDILYLDPPYNGRQYPPYYHILETAVLYDRPAIYGITGRRPYQELLSPFCMKDKALPAMLDIVQRAKFSNIYISYSTDGIMDYKKLCYALSNVGDVDCFFKPYRRYKSNSGGNDTTSRVKEIIIYVKKR